MIMMKILSTVIRTTQKMDPKTLKDATIKDFYNRIRHDPQKGIIVGDTKFRPREELYSTTLKELSENPDLKAMHKYGWYIYSSFHNDILYFLSRKFKKSFK